MKTVIKLLEEERSKIIEHLKNGEKDYSANLRELDEALNWIKKLDELNMEKVQRYNIIKLPEPCDYDSEYRIMIDYSTEDRMKWEELEINNKPICMTMWDIVITRKPG